MANLQILLILWMQLLFVLSGLHRCDPGAMIVSWDALWQSWFIKPINGIGCKLINLDFVYAFVWFPWKSNNCVMHALTSAWVAYTIHLMWKLHHPLWKMDYGTSGWPILLMMGDGPNFGTSCSLGVALHKHTYFMDFQHLCFSFKTCWTSVCKDWYKVSCVAI